MRVSAAKATGRDAQAEARAEADRLLKENCDKAMRKQKVIAAKRLDHNAQEEEASEAKAERQAEKQAEAAAKKRRRADEKAVESQRKADKKAAKADEKARRYLGGMAWGYDPNAGVNHPPDRLRTDTEPKNCHSEGRSRGSRSASRGHNPQSQYYDRITGRYYPKNEFASIWGIEIGGRTSNAKAGPHHDRFADAMAAGVNKTCRIDHAAFCRDSEPSPDIKGKAKAGVDQL